MVHIREYAEDAGKEYPTKKGASFNSSAWTRFLSHFDEMERMVDLLKSNQHVDYHQHVGGRYYVSINNRFRCVNIRRYFLPPNCVKEMPTRSGIALRLDEWSRLLQKIPSLNARLPELKGATSCSGSLDHFNHQDYLNCKQCNPFQTKS